MADKKAFDMDGDGIVTEKELELQQRIIELENSDKKADQQRRMASIALLSMLIVTVFIFTPIITPDKLIALSEVITMFYIAMAGIIAAFFGSSAYMSVNK